MNFLNRLTVMLASCTVLLCCIAMGFLNRFGALPATCAALAATVLANAVFHRRNKLLRLTSKIPAAGAHQVFQLNSSMYELYSPPGKPSMEVLFFHGFQHGDYKDAHLSTWKCRDGSSIWPQTWLVEKFHDARILSVSYDASVINSCEGGNIDMHVISENLTSDLLSARIGQEPRRPVALVGHSFGGLVIKQICVFASSTTGRLRRHSEKKIQLTRFLENVSGIFFYSTPHHGVVDHIAEHFVAEGPLLEYVKTLSTPRARINFDFDNLCGQDGQYKMWQIAGLGESLRTKSGSFSDVVVEEASARYGTSFNVVERADHISVCRPIEKTCRSFSALANFLEGVVAVSKATGYGNLDLAKYLRRKGAELNADDDNGQSPLHGASIQAQEPLVRFLLSEEADKRVEDDKGMTAMDSAKDDFVISWMLRFGHSLEDRNLEKKDTALGYAAWAGNAEAVGHLLEQGANVEARNGHQYTSLMNACRHGRIEVVKLLLKHGANKEARVGDEGWTPLLLGVVYRQIEVVQLMIAAGGNMETKSKHTGHTSLCEALWQRHWEIARLLLNSGADIHARDCLLYTPLNRAAMDGYVDDVKLILDKGADINAKNKDGWSSLTEASYLGYSDVVAFLLSRGITIDGQDHGLATPLYLAAKSGHTIIVSQLLAAGANPSAQNIEGWTPLEAAAWHGFDEVASLLLSAGADPNIPDKSGYTPLCKAAWAQRVAVALVLLENGAYVEAANKDDWTSLTEAAFYGSVEMIELLLDHGANIETQSQKFAFKDEGGFTPLMRAAERGHLAASEYLLSRGANVEAKSSIHGWTPLFLAVSKKHEKIVKRLIQGGADIWAANKTGRTPVMEAATVGGYGMVKMIKKEFEKAKARGSL